jgi:hypothetical protein
MESSILDRAHDALISGDLPSVLALLAEDDPEGYAPTLPAPKPAALVAVTDSTYERLRARAERRLIERIGASTLQRLAYGAVRRAALRSDDRYPRDEDIARYWVDALALVAPRRGDCPAARQHMQNALDAYYEDGTHVAWSMRIFALAATPWQAAT